MGNVCPSHYDYRRASNGQQGGLPPPWFASILRPALTHPGEQSRQWRPATIVLAVFVAIVLLGGLGAGLALDDRLGTRPIATLVCSLMAAHIAVIVVYRRVSTALRDIAEAGRGPVKIDSE